MGSRFIALAAALALLAGCAGGGSTLAPGGARMLPAVHAAPAARGSVIAVSQGILLTKKQMSRGLFGKVVDQVGGSPQCDVMLYDVQYATVGVSGEPATANEGMFVPQAPCKGPFPVVAYAHGTNLVKSQLISNPATISATWTPPDQDPYVVANVFASHGYVVAATDYLGLGESNYPYHPYLHADSEASAVIDGLRAGRSLATADALPLSGSLFLTGHSQGGQTAVATQRAIEAMGGRIAGFKLRGDAPSSGPYALSQTFEDSLRKQSEDAPILAAYTLTGYQKIYGNIYTDPTQVFLPPYAATIDTLLPVQTFKQEADLEGKTLPLQLDALLQTTFKKSFLYDPQSPARVDTAKNDLLAGWTAKTPMYVCGGSRDPEVEYKNAKLAARYFGRGGTAVTLADVDFFIPASVPIADYHVVVALFCLPLGRMQLFDRYR